MVSLADIRSVTASDPSRIVIYGPPGVGKTTLAAEFPMPVFIQTEDGQSAGLAFDSFGLLTTWTDVFSALRTLSKPGHHYQTLVIDSLDRLETVIWQDYCNRENLPSVSPPNDYGRSYVEIDAYWHELFRGLNYLRTSCGMTTILIGHSHVINCPNPTGTEFPKWDFRLHKRAHGIVEDSVDAVLMLDYDMTTTDQKGNGGVRSTKSTGSTLRYLHCVGSPARNAKNRYSMPVKFLYQQGELYPQLARYLPGQSSTMTTEHEVPFEE